MEKPGMPQEINTERIRKQELEGEMFYCVIDIVGELLDLEHQAARNYYKVLKT